LDRQVTWSFGRERNNRIMSTAKTIKLGDPLSDNRPVEYGRVWMEEKTTGSARLRIAASTDGAELLQRLARTWTGSMGVLYVLLVPRQGRREPGRYQSPIPLTLAQVNEFLAQFKDFFESDGRHHVWVASPEGGGTLVFDNHNWICAYGDLAAYRDALRDAGYAEGVFKLPVPHSHHYHAERDVDEEAVMQYWDWKYCPLQPGDDP
jgi:hypothetical protein